MTLIRTPADLLQVLDELFADEAGRWDRFFAGLQSDHPLATGLPDENLLNWHAQGLLGPVAKGLRVLDIGCGEGRNALWLASQGFAVEALDLSVQALAKAETRARDQGHVIRFHQGSLFALFAGLGGFDLVYDAGLLHHIQPHRRPDYLAALAQLVRPGGKLGLVCFNERMGTRADDLSILRQGSMAGGRSYSESELEYLFAPNFAKLEYRPMRPCAADEPCVGWDFLAVSLWLRQGQQSCSE